MFFQEIIKHKDRLTSKQKYELVLFFASQLQKEEKKLFNNFFNIKIDFEYQEIDEEKQKDIYNKKYRRFGMLKGKIKISDDFDEPLECFKDYM